MMTECDRPGHPRRRIQPIHLIGVEFSKKARNLAGFEVRAA
jgi:hypothetical protein